MTTKVGLWHIKKHFLINIFISFENVRVSVRFIVRFRHFQVQKIRRSDPHVRILPVAVWDHVCWYLYVLVDTTKHFSETLRINEPTLCIFIYQSFTSVTSCFVGFIWLLEDSRPMFHYLIHLCLLFTFGFSFRFNSNSGRLQLQQCPPERR